MKALIVDDDLALADVVAFTMRRAGYDVILAHDGQAALDLWRREEPDLILLDLNLPKMDGLKVCQHIRREADTPVIILSVRGEEDDVVRGLELGADDYVVKPFSPRALIARAEAVLRRAKTPPLSPAPLTAGDLTLDPARGVVQRGADAQAAQLTGQWSPLDWSPDNSRLLLMEFISINESYLHLLDLSTGKLENLELLMDEIEFIEGDLRDPKAAAKAAAGADFVLHQAAIPSVPRSIEDPIGSTENNLNGTLHLLMAARDAGVFKGSQVASKRSW